MISRTKKLVLGVIRYNLYSELQTQASYCLQRSRESECDFIRMMYMNQANAIDILFDMLDHIVEDDPKVEQSDLDFLNNLCVDSDIETFKEKIKAFVKLCIEASADADADADADTDTDADADTDTDTSAPQIVYSSEFVSQTVCA